MIRNYLKIAYRNLLRNKGFSVINITGLAIGMAAAMLILFWIRDEVSYDQFHQNKDRIYQVYNRVKMEGKISSWGGVSAPTTPAIQKDLPDVERVVRVISGYDALLTAGDKKITGSGSLVDTGFLQVFTFPLIEGDASTALNNKYSVVLTAATAKSLFGSEDPLGRMVKIGDKDQFAVTGVMKDPPGNSSFTFEYLLPYSYLTYGKGQDLGWGDNSTPTFVLLKPHVQFASAEAKIKGLKQRYDEGAKKMNWQLFLYPISRWHLFASFTNGVEDGGGQITFIKLFGAIAGFILLIACINFMNLTTARSEKRGKEVGIRKVVGAQKGSLIVQFIGESVLLAFLAGILAVFIVQLCLPGYNQLTHKNLFLDFGSVNLWIAFTGFILLVGLLAGSYPAFFLSSFKPSKVLKGSITKAKALVTPRKILVVLQFTFAIVMIICTVIIKQQIDYARDRETGYNKANLIYHSMRGDIEKNYTLIKNELIASGAALSVTKTNSPLTERWSDGWGQDWDGKDPNDNTSFDRFLEDEGLGKTAGLQFVQGRDLDLAKYPTDSSGLIINESALKEMKFSNPIGKRVSDLGVDWHIVGVIKDFIFTSPYEPTRPILICGAKSSFMTFNTLMIKLNPNHPTAQNLQGAKGIFEKYNPDYPFDPKFVDEEYARKFEDEQLQGKLAGFFAALTVFISCLGLFGLAAYMAESRVKEIGIRKVLGASVAGITTLLSKDFVKLVIIAFIIASPIAWWGMHAWLQNYTYRVPVQWWVFGLTGLASVVIALATVSYQSIRAALANPAKSLKSE